MKITKKQWHLTTLNTLEGYLILFHEKLHMIHEYSSFASCNSSSLPISPLGYYFIVKNKLLVEFRSKISFMVHVFVSQIHKYAFPCFSEILTEYERFTICFYSQFWKGPSQFGKLNFPAFAKGGHVVALAWFFFFLVICIGLVLPSDTWGIVMKWYLC